MDQRTSSGGGEIETVSIEGHGLLLLFLILKISSPHIGDDEKNVRPSWLFPKRRRRGTSGRRS
jgi:hypothetical protein